MPCPLISLSQTHTHTHTHPHPLDSDWGNGSMGTWHPKLVPLHSSCSRVSGRCTLRHSMLLKGSFWTHRVEALGAASSHRALRVALSGQGNSKHTKTPRMLGFTQSRSYERGWCSWTWELVELTQNWFLEANRAKNKSLESAPDWASTQVDRMECGIPLMGAGVGGWGGRVCPRLHAGQGCGSREGRLRVGVTLGQQCCRDQLGSSLTSSVWHSEKGQESETAGSVWRGREAKGIRHKQKQKLKQSHASPLGVKCSVKICIKTLTHIQSHVRRDPAHSTLWSETCWGTRQTQGEGKIAQWRL